VRVVVADTGPLHYLVLIDAVELLPRMFKRVLVPEIVAVEMNRSSTPAVVRSWLATMPPWLERRSIEAAGIYPPRLGGGERAEIALAQVANAALLLMDDRAGINEARARGLQATGTLGVLERAGQLGFIDLPAAIARLKTTNFRYRPQLLDKLLTQAKRKGEA
jgi:predicted nucleic acid-binding protein